jgi:HD-GYP domain-containing protein (c-di-GMP phosphodiesterase class II)
MISNRPYRLALPVEEARKEIKRCIRTQFDPVVANAFLKTDTSYSTFERVKAAV